MLLLHYHVIIISETPTDLGGDKTYGDDDFEKSSCTEEPDEVSGAGISDISDILHTSEKATDKVNIYIRHTLSSSSHVMWYSDRNHMFRRYQLCPVL